MADKKVVIYFSTHFTRALRQLPKDTQELTRERDLLFRRNPFDPSLRTHKLSGKLKEYSSYSINRSLRILFKFVSDHEILYIDVGTHEIYR